MQTLYKLKRQLVNYWLSLGVFINSFPHKLGLGMLVLGISGLLFFGTFVMRPQKIEIAAATGSVPVPTQVVSLGHSEPIALRIPSLGVNASFISLGLKNDGTMQTPNNGEQVGWYKYAPTPGETGPAVVAGHVDTKAGPAVFAKLHTLQLGDSFEIDRADGTTARFLVNEVKQFLQDNFPTEEIYGNVNYAGIRLITCGGVFDREAKHYSHNTVVFGSLVTE